MPLNADQHALILKAEQSAVVFAHGDGFVLAEVRDGVLDTAAIQATPGKDYILAGVLAVVDGQIEAKCQPDVNSIYTMMRASLAFAVMVVDRLRQPQPQGDSAEWLQQLFKIPDPRNE